MGVIHWYETGFGFMQMDHALSLTQSCMICIKCTLTVPGGKFFFAYKIKVLVSVGDLVHPWLALLRGPDVDVLMAPLGWRY